MHRDEERIARVTHALINGELDAVICTRPSNILMLTGYWPMIGSSIVIVTREGQVMLAVPEDEQDLAACGWADEIRAFPTGSLDRFVSLVEQCSAALARLPVDFSRSGSLGFESGPWFETSGYAGQVSFGVSIEEMLVKVFPQARLRAASELLSRLRAALTARELDMVRSACRIAREAFLQSENVIAPGIREFEIAALLKSKLSTTQAPARCDGFAYCMSGPNSFKAYAAFQETRVRPIAEGDFVLLHCNSYCGGFWTDITRTYIMGEPAPKERSILNAVLEARAVALNSVRAGIKASEVDRAARDALSARGFGDAFKHPTGHGVGFAAIDHGAHPRIHPRSEEILETGMVFNIEPAVYIPDLGGFRQCEMVAVREHGAELLTPFQDAPENLVIDRIEPRLS